jgi:HD-like signal output (HDOD) protein
MVDSPTPAGLIERRSIQKRVLANIENLPSLSTVVGEFLQLASREYYTAMDFEKVLVKDQALVARLLKVANSSFFSSSRTIKTVHEAVVLIGMDNMKNIVYAVSSSGLLRRHLKVYRYPEKGFWLHAMAVGIGSRTIMEEARDRSIGHEEAFVAGLIHDIGKLILDEFLDTAGSPRSVSRDEERDCTGFDHADLAEKIMERWKIPASIKSAVRFHHDPAPEGALVPGACVVNMADRLCNRWGIGVLQVPDLGAEVRTEEFAAMLEAIQLPESRFLPVLWEMRQKLALVENFYGDEA